MKLLLLKGTRKWPINVGPMDQFARSINVDDAPMNDAITKKSDIIGSSIFGEMGL